MLDATWPPCSSPRRHSRARGNRDSRGGRTRPTCRARATSNQAFVDVIIARKRAPSHRVFVAQVFGRNMCGKRRGRHRFSAFWLRSSVATNLAFNRLVIFLQIPPKIPVLYCRLNYWFVSKKILHLLVVISFNLAKAFSRYR